MDIGDGCKSAFEKFQSIVDNSGFETQTGVTLKITVDDGYPVLALYSYENSITLVDEDVYELKKYIDRYFQPFSQVVVDNYDKRQSEELLKQVKKNNFPPPEIELHPFRDNL